MSKGSIICSTKGNRLLFHNNRLYIGEDTDIVKSTIELCQLHIHFKDELRETSKKRKKKKQQRKKVMRSSESRQRKITVRQRREDLKKRHNVWLQEKQNVRGHVTRHDLSALDPTEKSLKCHSMHSYIIQYSYDVTVMWIISSVPLDRQERMHVYEEVTNQVFISVQLCWDTLCLVKAHVWLAGVILHPFICIWYSVIKRVRQFMRQRCPVRQLCPGYKKRCVPLSVLSVELLVKFQGKLCFSLTRLMFSRAGASLHL